MKNDLNHSVPVKGMTNRIARLSSSKQALLLSKLHKKVESHSKIKRIYRRPGPQPAPLSFAQERLSFIDKLHSGRADYNVPVAVRIKGLINIQVLEQSLKLLIKRHEILRSTFTEKAGQMTQLADPAMKLELSAIDLENKQDTEREKLLESVISREASRPFDLTRGPLMRSTLIGTGQGDQVLLLVMHHIVTDGRSLEILFSELSIAYAAFVAGKTPSLPELAIQYADFAIWQRQRLKGDVLTNQLAYWKNHLDGVPVLAIPSDRQRPPVMSSRGGRQRFLLQQSLTLRLKALSRQEGGTLFMTLLGVFLVLLHRYSGQDDIAVGSPVASRNRREFEGLIGFFSNTLVLRTDLSGNPTFRELLRRVREVILEAFTHQELPFEKLVAELQPDRNQSHTPLFQVMFILQHAPDQTLELPGMEISEVHVNTGTSKFDLTLTMMEKGNDLRGCVEYSTDLFDAGTIQRMTGHFITLCQGITDHPDKHLPDLPLLTHAEQHQLLKTWNDTQKEYPGESCVHVQFEARAAQAPDAVSVMFKDQSLTYRELNSRANQVARFLGSRRVEKGDPVGICMDPSMEMIIGVTGILKAGGTYVPMDPSCPGERLVFMLEDTGARVLLIQQHLMKRIPHSSADVVCLDSDWPSMARERDENLTGTLSSDCAAYIMYTSGSTGVPKGVEIPHRAINRLVLNTNYIELTPEDRVLQASNFSFDAATFEIWGALCNGATLILADRNEILSLPELKECLHKNRITTLFLTTAWFNTIARQCPSMFHTLKHLLFGGEAVDSTCAQKVLKGGPPHRMLNVYGPTETTTFATYHEVDTNNGKAQNIPLGRPIANTEVYILDKYLNPVPVGVPGEMHIGGDGLALGYLNRPELTAERFIPHLFRSSRNARLYKTGDLARFQADGNIEFLGRKDNQVKIRGFRIETGEIEAALLKHKGVCQAVVLAREMKKGEMRLEAYCVSGSLINTYELRRFLEQILPGYMVPSAFVMLDALPLTSNGKVDRKSLPGPGQIQTEQKDRYTAPRTSAERTLCKIWEELLGLTRVGIDDNFFELGGHSLLSVTLFFRIEQVFGRKLQLSTIFEAPSIAELGRILDERIQSPCHPSFVSLGNNQGRKPPIYFLHSLGGELFFGKDLVSFFSKERPVFGFKSLLDSGDTLIEEGLELMADKYVKELLAFQSKGPYCLSGYSFGGFLAYEIARKLLNMGHEVPLLAILDTGPPRKTTSFYGQIKKCSCLFRNFPYWIAYDLMESTPREFGLRMLRKGRAGRRKILGFLKQKNLADTGPQLQDIFDMKSFPEEKHVIMNCCFQALQKYDPKPYPGQITLFRALAQPLLSSEHDLGWGRLASGGVETVDIPGNHATIFKKPHMQTLGQKMAEILESVGDKR